MTKFINLVGQKFGKLTVLKRTENAKNRAASRWLCKCDCGKEKIIRSDSLRNGNTQSCGCFKSKGNNYKHGHAKRKNVSRIYKIWKNIIMRCYNPKSQHYRIYGDRGIIVCERWLKFENFLEDMGEPPTDKYTIDRINNDRGYYKENCRWSTSKEQQRNKRNNHLLKYNNKIQCIAAWAEEYNIIDSTLRSRLKNGWSIEKAIEKKILERYKNE